MFKILLMILVAMLASLVCTPQVEAGPCRSGNCQVQASVQKGLPVQKWPVRRFGGRLLDRLTPRR
jgi:hypothetical protein